MQDKTIKAFVEWAAWYTIIVTALFFLVATGHCQENGRTPMGRTTAGWLVDNACAKQGDLAHIVCGMYIEGSLDGYMDSVQPGEDGTGISITQAKKFTAYQALPIFVNFVATHPDTRKQSAGLVLMFALEEAGYVRFVHVGLPVALSDN